jgi:hypothetical protein
MTQTTTPTPDDVSAIVSAVASNFRCFGGAEKKASAFNPLVEALSLGPVNFAMGVGVADVVRFVLAADPRDAVIRELTAEVERLATELEGIGAGYRTEHHAWRHVARDAAMFARALLSRLGLGVKL